MPAGSLTVSLDSANPIAGMLRAHGQPDRPFVGWVGLLAALDAAVRAVVTGDETKSGQDDGGRIP